MKELNDGIVLYLFKWLFHSPRRNRSLFWSAAIDLALLFHFVKQFCRQEQRCLLWHNVSNSCCSTKKRQRAYINLISIIRALISLTGTRFPFYFSQSTQKDLKWNNPFIHNFFFTFNLSYSFSGPQRNRKSAFKSTCRQHAMCNLSRGNKNKQWRALESLVNTEPRAALVCSPLGFPLDN